jgi:hypothetical protein
MGWGRCRRGIFYTPENVFSGYNFDAQQVLVEEGGYLEPLLEKETVTRLQTTAPTGNGLEQTVQVYSSCHPTEPSRS